MTDFSELYIALAAILAYLVTFGAGYAVFIYYRPFPHGYTYWSVVIGVGATLIGEWVAILAITVTVLRMPVLGLTFICISALSFALTGIPMIIGQRLKQHNQNIEAESVVKKFNGQ